MGSPNHSRELSLKEFERYFKASLSLGLSNYATATHMGISIREYRNRLKNNPHLMDLYVKSHQKLETEHVEELKRLAYEEGNVQALKYLENQLGVRRHSIATFKEKAVQPAEALGMAKQRLADKLLDRDMSSKDLDTIIHALLDIEKHDEFKKELLEIIKEYKSAKDARGLHNERPDNKQDHESARAYRDYQR